MDPWLIAVLIKPFAALAFFSFAFLLAQVASRFIPEGAIKRVLYDRSLQKRHPWKFGLGFLVAGWGVIGLIAYLVS